MFAMFRVDRVLDQIMHDEGYRAEPYLCTAGVWTIGFGTTRLYGEPVTESTPVISRDDAMIVLKADVLNAIEDCQDIYGDTFALLHMVHQEILICLAYQLGRDRLQGFQKMNTAIKAFDYRGWQRELRDSRLYEQTTKRVDRYLQVIERAAWPTDGAA